MPFTKGATPVQLATLSSWSGREELHESIKKMVPNHHRFLIMLDLEDFWPLNKALIPYPEGTVLDQRLQRGKWTGSTREKRGRAKIPGQQQLPHRSLWSSFTIHMFSRWVAPYHGLRPTMTRMGQASGRLSDRSMRSSCPDVPVVERVL
jgi:hypothetical protein